MTIYLLKVEVRKQEVTKVRASNKKLLLLVDRNCGALLVKLARRRF